MVAPDLRGHGLTSTDNDMDMSREVSQYGKFVREEGVCFAQPDDAMARMLQRVERKRVRHKVSVDEVKSEKMGGKQ